MNKSISVGKAVDSDDKLINAACSGDLDAFEILAEKYYLFVYQSAYKLCRSKTDAEEITQDVYIKLAKKLSTYNQEAAFKTWLYRIIINTAKDHWKKQSRIKDKETQYLESENNQNIDREEKQKIRQKVLSIIEQMPSKLKETAFLVFTEGLSHGEAARVLLCAETTISWRVFQIKKKIKQQLKLGESYG